MDHIFLTDNNTTDGAEQREVLADRFPRAFLTLRNELEPRGQLKVYAWCAEEQRAAYNWIAFMDVDEYIVLRDSCVSSPAVPSRSTVWVTCLIFSASTTLHDPCMHLRGRKHSRGCTCQLAHSCESTVSSKGS